MCTTMLRRPDIDKLFGEDTFRLWSDLERYLDRMLATPNFGYMRLASPNTAKVAASQARVGENENAYFIQADIPGFLPEEVKVELDQNVLTITAQKARDEARDQDGIAWRGYARQTVTLRYQLPDDVKTDQVEATLDNGVLTVKLPKTEEHKKVIEIHVKKPALNDKATQASGHPSHADKGDADREDENSDSADNAADNAKK